MGMKIDDNVKQKLLDKLSEEPPMVISTAYTYAKNYVNYGEDITKAWNTVVQQESIIEKVRQKAWVEAYDSFKKEYENHLKVDMVAMLDDLNSEIRKLHVRQEDQLDAGLNIGVTRCSNLVQQKIDSLKEKTNDYT